MGAATSGLTAGTASGAASLVLTGSRGYLLGAGRDAVRRAGGRQRAVAAGRRRSRARSGRRWPDGQPTGALLGAVNAANLVLACASSSGPGERPAGRADLHLAERRDQLAARRRGAGPGLAYLGGGQPAETVVLATGQGIDVLPAGEHAWQPATLDGRRRRAGSATWA